MVSHKLARRQAHRPQDERGQVIVLMVLMMIVLLGFAALIVDTSGEAETSGDVADVL